MWDVMDVDDMVGVFIGINTRKLFKTALRNFVSKTKM